MEPTIYIDVLISVNLFISYSILIATSKFLYLKTNKKRIFLGAFLGALYSLSILLPELNFFVSLIVKLIMSIIIVIVTFGFNFKNLLKITSCFYFMNIAFSGFIFILWFIFEPSGVILNNTEIYFNILPNVLVIFTIISYFTIQIINRFVGNCKIDKDYSCNLEIKVSNNIISLNAKIDTGNNLKEPFSNIPVLVVCEDLIKNVIPDNIRDFLCKKDMENVNLESLNTNVRIIPFKTISGEGLLPAFKPDYITILDKKNQNLKKEVYIAICSNKILDGNCKALINPEVLL
ncbi:MAG: sigma-E processing peptidase SpoIIGA [Candidatus Paraimprobicoccus trichonymphae]|uniref:Sporulation sigma-E factor-processing peptidase n=1 Tax=Candidatus Paraimprobicoccus trichonymphae TaxID=3033793 RepID=A0AA48I2I4_9FIRM|nr:MAG: sigma-E processing peptidase SpoIIGA [Candidatus Paraimprobicoccus trichonymphae]